MALGSRIISRRLEDRPDARVTVTLFKFCLLATLFFARTVSAATPAEVDKAIERAREFVLQEQLKNGLWDASATPPTDAEVGLRQNGILGGQWGGTTALATYALLAAGESPTGDKLAKAVAFLKTADLKGTYALGLRTQMYQFLPATRELKEDAMRDIKTLANGAYLNGSTKGLYNYLLDPDRVHVRFDHSVSQYGVLGIWACQRTGAEVNNTFWQMEEDAWNRDQAPDGSWSYGESGVVIGYGKNAVRRSTATASMTVAGIATLYITQDYVHQQDGLRCEGNTFNPHIEAGLNWISENFERVFTDPGICAPYYALYGVERVGVASGRKYLGKVDWYQRGADFLLANQTPRGSWGTLDQTCFAILFLARGRAPVIFNKLEYRVGGKDGNWNQRARDVANLTHWIARETERDLNWQIVDLSGSADDLLEAPVLYISGNKPLQFTPAEEAKLRQFCEDGGLILGNPDCDSSAFSASFRKLGGRLFHMYEFHELPKSHVIYTGEQWPRGKWKPAPSVLSLSNGVRELMVLPNRDAAHSWQLQDPKEHPADYQLPDDVLLYAIDKQNLMEKGGTFVVREDKNAAVTRTIKLARLEYPGNWDPEPGGWRRMTAILHNSSHIKLDISVVKLGEHKLGNGTGDGPKVAVLTGTAKTQLTADARADLKQFVEGGGTLIADSAGGSSDFATSLESELEQVCGPTTGAQLAKHLPASAPIFNLPGGKITEFVYRPFARETLGSLHAPMLSVITVNNRPAVYYSRLDLSAGLVGQPTDGIVGYSPATATAIMTNLVISGGLGQNASVAAVAK
jgi:hypothetical protein